MGSAHHQIEAALLGPSFLKFKPVQPDYIGQLCVIPVVDNAHPTVDKANGGHPG